MKALLTSLFLLLSTLPPHAKQTETSCIDSLQTRMQHYMEAQAWDSAAWYGDRFLEAAYQKKDWYGSVIDAHMALGLIYAHLGNYTTAMSNLGQAHQNGMGGQREEAVKTAFARVLDIVKEEQRRIVAHQKNQQLLIGGLIALLSVCGLLYYMYWQKHRLLTAIVRQNHEALQREESTEQRTKGMTDQKKRHLLMQLEKLMQQERTYCENLLTKERVAELLNTNRTYLSQVINEAYGKSFTQYINDLRINEAIRLLDDPTNMRALRLICQDLGFNSQTTFNTQFQSRTGMTPAQYRKKVQELNS